MFSVENDDPFIIFRELKSIARVHCAEADILDLSRGDPGFCFTPSRRGRRFGSYVLWLDSILNTSTEDSFLRLTEADAPAVWARIERATRETYSEEAAKEHLSTLREFIAAAVDAAQGEGKRWSDFEVLHHLFTYCPMSGGSYLLPEGQELTRTIVAAWHRQELGVPVCSADLILTSGANHAIGTIFKALGNDGCGFLVSGDSVAIASPVYSPYNGILEERGIETISFSIDPQSGMLDQSDLAELRKPQNRLKALILIDPNNPCGFSLSEESLAELAAIARERNLLVITDEVYLSLFPQRKKTMLALCPERTIHINARSKIERATGLRFGEFIILPEGYETIAKLVGLRDATALRTLLILAKAPGRCGGQFQHVTFVPGPSQLLGIAHIVLGATERAAYLRKLERNRAIFNEELALTHKGNLYYVIFDLNTLPHCTTTELPMEERLKRLAAAGVIYLPAYRFFAENKRSAPGVRTSVRASVVNTTPDRLQEAARRTKKVLCT